MEIDEQLWRDAAAAYARQKQVEQPTQDEPVPPRPLVDPIQKRAAVQALQRFLTSAQGAAATELLRASGQHIVIAQENEGGGYATVYFLDGDGLHRSVEAAGMWVAYASRVPAPNITPATCEEVVSEAVFQGTRPEEILPQLIQELNAIAIKIVNPGLHP